MFQQIFRSQMNANPLLFGIFSIEFFSHFKQWIISLFPKVAGMIFFRIMLIFLFLGPSFLKYRLCVTSWKASKTFVIVESLLWLQILYNT